MEPTHTWAQLVGSRAIQEEQATLIRDGFAVEVDQRHPVAEKGGQVTGNQLARQTVQQGRISRPRQFAVEDAKAHHVPFAIETVMRTGYEIDKFQRAYFVLPSFETLRSALETADIAAIIGRWKDAAPLDPSSA